MGFKTREVLQELNASYHRVHSVLRSGKVTPPAKDVSGDFAWTAQDVEAVRHAMTIDRRRKDAREAHRV